MIKNDVGINSIIPFSLISLAISFLIEFVDELIKQQHPITQIIVTITDTKTGTKTDINAANSSFSLVLTSKHWPLK